VTLCGVAENTRCTSLCENSVHIALLKCPVNVLCIVGSVKYLYIRYKTTRALKLFQETQSWVPHCTYVAYLTTRVLLRTGTDETDVRKQTDVTDWWNWMWITLMCGPLTILSKRGTASFYILVRNSNVMSEHSTRSPHFRIPAKRLLK
jgi:purine-cytosine permease-like protein